MANKRLDVLGKKFGRLTVLEITERQNKARAPLYKCECECGNIVFRSATKLMVSANPRCSDCIVAPNKRVARTAAGESGLNYLWCSYKKGADSRKLSFQLTKEEFKHLTSSDCVYCGAAPSKISYGSRGFTKDWGAYLCNGIDRINNEVGYILTNCVPCCELCNKMKMGMDVRIFLDQCRKITNQQLSKLQFLEPAESSAR